MAAIFARLPAHLRLPAPSRLRRYYQLLGGTYCRPALPML